MKRFILRLLDPLVPPDVKEFAQIEELAKARALIFLLLINLISSIASLAGGLIINLPPTMTNNPIRLGLLACTVSIDNT